MRRVGRGWGEQHASVPLRHPHAVEGAGRPFSTPSDRPAPHPLRMTSAVARRCVAPTTSGQASPARTLLRKRARRRATARADNAGDRPHRTSQSRRSRTRRSQRASRAPTESATTGQPSSAATTTLDRSSRQAPRPVPCQAAFPCRDASTAAAPSSEDLPTRLVVTENQPCPSPELVTIAATLRHTSSSPAVPSACPTVSRAGPQPGRGRPECSEQPRGAPGIICPAQHPCLVERRRPRLSADSLSRGGSHGPVPGLHARGTDGPLAQPVSIGPWVVGRRRPRTHASRRRSRTCG
jgi:hypothetical protein